MPLNEHKFEPRNAQRHAIDEAPHTVDNTDWLKTAAIILVTVDHIDHFFIEDDRWWSVFGRLAAPTFFFLMGYAQTRTVPLHWIWLGVILTLLDSWNAGWTWVAPNILLSFALIRIARPYVQILLQHHGWPPSPSSLRTFRGAAHSGKIVDYGAEGWLWALFGVSQRMYVDDRSAERRGRHISKLGAARARDTEKVGLIRVLACFVATAVYIWQEQNGVLISAYPFRRLHSRRRHFVH